MPGSRQFLDSRAALIARLVQHPPDRYGPLQSGPVPPPLTDTVAVHRGFSADADACRGEGVQGGEDVAPWTTGWGGQPSPHHTAHPGEEGAVRQHARQRQTTRRADRRSLRPAAVLVAVPDPAPGRGGARRSSPWPGGRPVSGVSAPAAYETGRLARGGAIRRSAG